MIFASIHVTPSWPRLEHDTADLNEDNPCTCTLGYGVDNIFNIFTESSFNVPGSDPFCLTGVGAEKGASDRRSVSRSVLDPTLCPEIFSKFFTREKWSTKYWKWKYRISSWVRWMKEEKSKCYEIRWSRNMTAAHVDTWGPIEELWGLRRKGFTDCQSFAGHLFLKEGSGDLVG